MDHHFVITQVDGEKKPKNQFSLGRMIRTFLPVFILSSFLPVFVLLVLKPPQVGFFTKADQSPTLRLWFEPAQVVASSGNFTNLQLMASFESGTTLIPTISVEVSPSEGLTVDNPLLEHKTPFRGKIMLGTVQVVASSPGEYELAINKESVDIRAFDADLQIVTQPSKIIFR